MKSTIDGIKHAGAIEVLCALNDPTATLYDVSLGPTVRLRFSSRVVAQSVADALDAAYAEGAREVALRFRNLVESAL